jgi:predicted secreted hydrolase
MGIARSVRLAVLLALLCFGAVPRTLAAPARFARIRLPADAAMHPASPNEWWYVTGHLQDQAGRTYGYELVTFKLGNARQVAPLLPVNTLYRIDLAITDETHRKFSSTVTYLFPAPGKTMLSSRQLSLRMLGQGASLSIDTLPGTDLAYHLRGQLKAGIIDLTVRTTRPPLIEGANGVEQISDSYSYYYSLPHLRTTGTLILHGRRMPVRGLSWMDHQWGTWSWQKQKGWDWMAIQLDNGTSLSLLNFTAGPRTTAKYSGISFADGTQRFTGRAAMASLAPTWTSPRSHLTFPLSWHVTVPAIKLDAVVTATVPNQELVDTLDPYSTYWEGSGTLSGTLAGAPIRGKAYTELAGYAQTGQAPAR